MTSTSSRIRNQADEWAVEDGCWFDERAAKRVCEFFRKFLRHSKSDFKSQPFELMDWQREEIIYPLYGWKRANGFRRFRRAFIQIPKKNGKSTLCSGLSLYHLCADGENGTEVYNVAGDKSQASIVFDEANNMIEASPSLSQRLIIKKSLKRVDFPPNKSFYRVLASDASTKEGFNAGCIINDELHAQKNRKLFDTLRYSGAGRKQPMNIVITTAGDDEFSFWHEEYVYAKNVMDGIVRDDEYLVYIREATKQDDPFCEETWKKANPSYGVLIQPDEMRDVANNAKNQPSSLGIFLRYRLNIMTSSEARWISIDDWAKNEHKETPEPAFKEECYVGLDLSSTIDMAGYILFFPKNKVIIPRLWCPETTITKRIAQKRTRYDYWAAKGLVNVSKCDSLDYKLIEDSLVKDDNQYSIREIAFDPWNAAQFVITLYKHGFKLFPFRQGFGSYNAPMKEFQRMVTNGELTHYGNPLLAWMMSNVVAEEDSNKNLRPNKKKSKESIEGIICTLMGIGRWMLANEKRSIYADRGMVTS